MLLDLRSAYTDPLLENQFPAIDELDYWHDGAPMVNLVASLDFDYWNDGAPLFQVQLTAIRRRTGIF